MCTVHSVACKPAFQGSSFCLFTDQAGMTSITVSQIRSNFKKVAEHIKKANKRLTIEELFAICASAGPSQTREFFWLFCEPDFGRLLWPCLAPVSLIP